MGHNVPNENWILFLTHEHIVLVILICIAYLLFRFSENVKAFINFISPFFYLNSVNKNILVIQITHKTVYCAIFTMDSGTY